LRQLLLDAKGTASTGNDPHEALISESGSAGLEKNCPHTRREFIWMKSHDQAQLTSFRDIQQQFASAIKGHKLTKHTLRRLRSPDNQSPSRHRCDTYLKEEVVLGANLKDSAILTSLFPSIHEVCYICDSRVEEEDEEAQSKRVKSCKFIIQPALTSC
jgi:hypothetical protein